MTDLKISQFTDGGTIEETDIIAAVRSGVNTKVTVGSAATADVGSADEEIPDGSIVNQKIADALAVYTPPPAGDGNYGVITISSGVWDFTDGSYGDVSISGNDMEITNAPLASIKNLTTSANQGIRLTATDTYATYSLTDGGVALSGITGTALTIPYFPSTDTVGNLTFIDDDTFASATATSLSSSESIKAYVDASAGSGGSLIGTTYYTCPSQTVTISNATPAVFTYPSSGRDAPQNGCPVRLTTTGTLPPNFSTGVTYYVVNASGATSNLSLTKNGSAIAAGGAGTGTHTIQNAPYEKADNNPSSIQVTVVGSSGGHQNLNTAGGGGGGGGARKIILSADLSSSETVTSGGAGSGITTGGGSSFGSHCSATAGSSTNTATSSGGVGSGGDINIEGTGGVNAGTNIRAAGVSAFGLSSGAAASGSGTGKPGIVIVEEYK